MRRVLSVVAAILLCASSLCADVQAPRGFDNKVYQATMALYGTLPKGTVLEADGDSVTIPEDVTHFLCTVTAFRKVKGGYELIGAGHCTAEANPDDLPKGLVYSVSDNLGTTLHSVKLLKAEMKETETGDVDYAVYFLKSDENIPVIPLGNEGMVEVGSETVNVNFSLGDKMTKQLTKGIVASQTAKLPSKIPGMILVQQFDSHGASGSSVVSEKTHQIIGLVIGGYDGTTTPSVIEPISKIRSLVGSVQP